MPLAWSNHGDQLSSFAAKSKAIVFIVAPYIKSESFKKICGQLPEQVQLVCVTRWKLDDIAAGVSDIDIWFSIEKRGNAKLFLLENLHAKYYRFDDTFFLGSSNVTNNGLGWDGLGNVELLLDQPADESSREFESFLLRTAIQVDERLFQRIRKLSRTLPKTENENFSENTFPLNEISKFSAKGVLSRSWLPHFRSPEYLFEVYSGLDSHISAAGLADAKNDLVALALPQGLNQNDFELFVQERLITNALVHQLDSFCAHPRRFGEITKFLSKIIEVQDANYSWQTLMRWLLHFSQEYYECYVTNYSEIFCRVNRD